MKILVLDEEFPYPTNTGKRTRSFNLYARLARRFGIRYVGFGAHDSEAGEALRAQGVETVGVPSSIPPKGGALFYGRLLLNLLSPEPYIVSSHDCAVYRTAVAGQIASFQPDLVLCEWTPYAIYVRNLIGPKKVVSAHNVEADIWQRYAETETNPLRRAYILEQWRKVARFEKTALTWVDALVAVSDGDRDRLAGLCPGLRTHTIPNGVDLEYFRLLPAPEARDHLVFTGSMDWRPNQDAARYFAESIFPLLRQQRPNLECTFVGRSPPPEIEKLARIPGFHVSGTVPDVRPYVERAAAYIVPLRVGGGSRLKILEALSMGRPVVSTTVGAEGLVVEPGKHLLLADDPAAFAQAVLRVLDDQDLAGSLVAEGARLVREKYGWDALAEQLGCFLQQVIASEPSACRAPSGLDTVAE
jgi:polysaccharide biosynthesis protein PslH